MLLYPEDPMEALFRREDERRLALEPAPIIGNSLVDSWLANTFGTQPGQGRSLFTTVEPGAYTPSPTQITVRPPMPPLLDMPLPPQEPGNVPLPQAPPLELRPAVQAEPAPAPAAPARDPILDIFEREDRRRGIMPLPDTPPKAPILQEGMAALWGNIADTLGVPVNLIDRAFVTASNALGNKPLEAYTYSEIVNNLKEAFLKVGIKSVPDDPTSTAAKVGHAALPAVTQATTQMFMAPGMTVQGITKALPGIWDQIVRQYGQYLLKRPGAALAAEAGATVGGVVGEEKGGVPGAFVGAFAGGSAADIVTRTGKAAIMGTGKVLERAGEYLPSGITGRSNAPYPEPIRPQGDPVDTRNFGKKYIDNEIAQFDKDIEYAFRKAVPSGLSSSDVNYGTVVRELEAAKGAGKAAQSAAWNDVDLRQVVPNTHLENVARKQVGAWTDIANPERPLILSELPKQFTDLILSPDFGHTNSLLRLRSLRQDIFNARQALPPDSSGTLKANMAELEEAVLETMRQGLPGNDALTKAREVSRAFNDRFTRGPIGDVLAKDKNGRYYTDPSKSIPSLIKQPGGLAELLATDRAELKSAMEDTIRSMYGEAVKGAPEKARKYMTSVEKSIRPMTEVASDLEATTKRVTELRAHKAIQEESALNKFIGVDPKKGIDQVFGVGDPAENMRRLVGSVKGDQEALEGLHTGVIDYFMRRSGGSGLRLLTLLNEPQNARALQMALPPDKYARLQRMAHVVQEVELGKGVGTSRIGKTVFGATMFGSGALALGVDPMSMTLGAVALGGAGAPFVPNMIAGWLGAQASKTLAHSMGSGASIQAAGYGASGARRSLANLTAKFAPTTIDPSVMFQMAVRDASWEKLLLSRAPTSVGEMKALQIRMARLQSAFEGGRRSSERFIRNKVERPVGGLTDGPTPPDEDVHPRDMPFKP